MNKRVVLFPWKMGSGTGKALANAEGFVGYILTRIIVLDLRTLSLIGVTHRNLFGGRR